MPDCENCPKAPLAPKERWVAPKRQVPISGILNVDKPPDMTSHDVVDVVRRVAGQRKVGHAGTLDPMATGVLLVCLGQATRVSEYLMAGRKRYRATVVLGVATDTYDAEGQVISEGGRTDFFRAEIEAALRTFVGRIEQVPPMYSAIKVGGRSLHKLAREGLTVERPPRPVEIDEIILLNWAPPALIIEVACSPGTYIRSLAHDLGQHLGSAAHLSSLVRLASGCFSLEDAVSLERLEEAFEHGQETDYLLPLDQALLDRPALVVGEAGRQCIVHGQAVQAGSLLAGPDRLDVEDGGLGRAYDLDGEFVAVLAYEAAQVQWRPVKVFAGADSDGAQQAS